MLATGCAGSNGAPSGRVAGAVCVPSTDVAAEVPTADGQVAVAIAVHDDRFDPACVALASVSPVLLVLRNEGRHPHNLTLDDGRSVAVDAGQVAILETEMDADTMRFVCTIHPGMEGELRARR